MDERIPFTEAEIALLVASDWEPLGLSFRIRIPVLLGCGCCSDTDDRVISKLWTGYVEVAETWATGGGCTTPFAPLIEALDAF